MKILVLGSAGQIGKPLVKYLKNKNHEVVEFDIVDSYENDLRVESILEKIIQDIDFVFFLAFDVGGSKYLEKYQKTYSFVDNNIKLMSNTFEILKKYNKKFIFTSTQMSNMGYSSYGTLKRIGEIYTEVLGGINCKLWNVYGYEEDLEKSHVVTDFILMSKNKNLIQMRTDGEEERQLLYSEDCCECLYIIMKNYDDIDRNKNIHISSFEWVKIKDIANIIHEINKNCKIIKNEKIDDIQLNKRNEPEDYILKFWKPKTKLKEGIIKLYNLY
jgi:nucleoside-diphosphate-sugar epimerase